jgi:DME family drug/metabolite transporter
MGSILFGTTGTSQFFAPSGIDPTSTGAIRLAIGGPMLGLLALAYNIRSSRGFGVPPLVPLILSVSGVALYQLCFFKAVLLTGVSAGTLVTMGSVPVIAGLIGYFFLKETIDLRWCTATIMTLSGCCLLVLPKSNISIDSIGILLAIGAGCGISIYMVTSKRLVAYGSPLPMVAIVLTAAAVILFPILMTTDLSLWFSPRGISVALWLGVVATGFSYLLLTIGLATTPVSNAALLTLAEPMVACFLGILVVGEPLTLYSSFGMLLIFCGLVVVSLQPAKLANR